MADPTDSTETFTWRQLWPLIVFLTLIAAVLAGGIVLVALWL